ncbi:MULTISPECIES: SCO1664 family protein [unclassified Brachybacterium]|uniref:SCO1664 family protein n=1 Tax=unclassified Brachybacterium TaxID=2623841 RepID=UPI0036205202
MNELHALETEPIELLGGIVGSSNETFLVRLGEACADVHAVYKPELGERPLHDFPPGLYRRERAAYLLSQHLGWGLVPPTVIREDGPFGVGSYQLFRHHDPDEHYFTLYTRSTGHVLPVVLEGFGDPFGLGLLEASADGAGEDVQEQLRRLAVFDILANNADRKAGHVLRGTDGRVWAIDHGLCFSEDLKLRTVIWDFAGEALEDETLESLWDVVDEVPAEVADLLEPAEVRALQGRARWLTAVGELPGDPTGMRFPWPLI